MSRFLGAPKRLSVPGCRMVLLLPALLTMCGGALLGPGAGFAVAGQSYAPISGAGSTWAENAVDEWRRDVGAEEHPCQIVR